MKIIADSSGKITERELTKEEISQLEIDSKKSAEIETLIVEEKTLINKAKVALLEKLGITEEEAKLLLSQKGMQ